MATYRVGQKTHPPVLPQQLALEFESADTPRIGDETGLERRKAPVAVHVRGEMPDASPGAGRVTPNREVGEKAREGHPVVFILDKHGTPLQPTSPARARKLLKQGRAVVARHTPFVIRLKDRTAGQSQIDGVELGIDPGSKHTGIAVFTARDGERRGLYAVELAHRGGVLAKSPKQLARILAQAKTPLRDAAAVNATRWALWRALDTAFSTVHTASGGRTKWNRQRTSTPKTHTLDALCVGHLDAVTRTPARVLAVAATGRGTYARTRTDKYGFPRLRLPRQKTFFGYQTGDLARAVVPTGKKTGTHTGRIAVRATGSFNIKTAHGLVQGIGHKHVRLLQRADGYAYTTRPEGPTVAI